MKYKLIFLGLLVLAIIINHQWTSKSCSYCFQGFLADNYLFEDKDIGFSSEYIDNTIAISRHNTTNYIGRFFGGLLQFRYLNFLFWILVATLSTLLFYKKLFYLEAGIFAALVYLTNPTLPVTIHTIAYYFLSLYFIYRFLVDKKIIYIFLFLITLLVSFNVDISPSFVILTTSFFITAFYFILNKSEIDKKTVTPYLFLLAVFILIAFFEKNFIIDLFRRTPLILNKIIFYVSSYPKSTYFYLYLISRAIFIPLPVIYIYRKIKTGKLAKRECFIFSYFLTIFPLAILFTLFDVAARVFDYYTPLLAALSFIESKRLFNKKLRKRLVMAVTLFLILFSIFLHYIPPRSLETYSGDFLEGLSVIPGDAVVYTDVFVANALITKLDHLKVIGADFNRGDEYLKVYYEKDAKYIKNLFKSKNVEYFVISKQSSTRGLEILNGPHILRPITIEGYDNIFERVYSNDEVYIWRVNESSDIS